MILVLPAHRKQTANGCSSACWSRRAVVASLSARCSWKNAIWEEASSSARCASATGTLFGRCHGNASTLHRRSVNRTRQCDNCSSLPLFTVLTGSSGFLRVTWISFLWVLWKFFRIFIDFDGIRFNWIPNIIQDPFFFNEWNSWGFFAVLPGS